MSFSIVRDAARRKDLAAKLRKQHPDWPEERLVAELAIITGVTERTARAYVEQLKKAERW